MSGTANSVILPQTPFSRTAVMTTAETTFNNPTNAVDLLLAADNVNGARIVRLWAIPRATIGTANNIQLYKQSGSTYTLIDSALMATVTPSASVANAKTDFGYSDDNALTLEAGVGLAVAMGQSIANGVVVRIDGAFY